MKLLRARANIESPLQVDVLAHGPTEYYHCTHCEIVWQQAGVAQPVHVEQRESALPAELHAEYAVLWNGVRDLLSQFGDRIAPRLIDVASVEGFFKSVRYNVHRYPAFIVDGTAYFVGTDVGQAAELITEALRARGASRAVSGERL